MQFRKQIFNILLEQRSIERLFKNNVLTNVLEFDALIIDVLFELIDTLKTIAINLNTLSKITLYTLEKRKIYINI